MKLTENFNIEYQINYKKLGINKISIHNNKKNAEKEIKDFLKKNIIFKYIKPEDIYEICEYIEILKIKKLKIRNHEIGLKKLLNRKEYY